MTAADEFRRRTAGKTVPVEFPAEPVTDIEGRPLGVDPPVTRLFEFDAETGIGIAWDGE